MVGEGAFDVTALVDQRSPLRLGMAKEPRTLDLVEISLVDEGGGEGVPPPDGETPRCRVQQDGVVIVVDIVRRQGGLHRPVKQLRIIENGAVQPPDLAWRAPAIDDIEFRLGRVDPHPGVVDERDGQEARHHRGEQQAPRDKLALKIRVGEATRDRSRLVSHRRFPF